MAKDPAVLLYTSDFLSGTFTMTDEQVGRYIRLLCLQHQQGKLTEEDMLSICKGHDAKIWSKFDLIDGYYVNKRMYEEAEKRANYTQSRRNNAKSKAYAEHMHKHMENENENINDNINNNINEGKKFKKPSLEDLLNLFSEKGHEDEAERFFNYYESNGWKVGKNPMKNWKAAVNNWIKNKKTYTNGTAKKSNFDIYQQYNKESSDYFAEYDRQFRPHVASSKKHTENDGC